MDHSPTNESGAREVRKTVSIEASSRRRSGWPTRPRRWGASWDLANPILAGIVRARVAAIRGDHAEAIAVAQRAVTLSDGSDDLRTQAQTRLAHAESLAAAGRRDEAIATARDALSRSERKGSVVLADRIRAFLARIEPGS